MSKAVRTYFYVRAFDDLGNQIMSSIQVIVPSGLTRDQATDFITGHVAAEMKRYGAGESLGLTLPQTHDEWKEIVT